MSSDEQSAVASELPTQANPTREEEKVEFEKEETEHSESVDALSRAIQTMQPQDYDRPQAEAFLQRMAKTSPGMQSVLAALVAYDSQGGGVVELMEDLLKKFKGELSDVVTEEGEKAYSYDLTMLHLSDTIKMTSLKCFISCTSTCSTSVFKRIMAREEGDKG